MRVRWLLPVLLLLAGIAGADAPKEDPGAADRKAMQGDWACASLVKDGEAVPADDAQALFRTVKDDHYTVSRFRTEAGKGTFKLDATKNPRTIDFFPEGAAAGSKPLLGIYEWTGKDRYRVCSAPPGQERPKDFTCKKGSNHTLVVWRREKE
jgi:uncharacterized protein (TIGR03067 family)